MFKKVIVLLTVALVAVGSWQCMKSDDDNNCTPVPPQNEDAAIQQYISANSIDATKDTTGIYYQIIEQGAGASPKG